LGLKNKTAVKQQQISQIINVRMIISNHNAKPKYILTFLQHKTHNN